MNKVLEKDPPSSRVWYEAAVLAEELFDYDNA